MSIKDRATRLRAAITLLTEASEIVIQHWEDEERDSSTKEVDRNFFIPSYELFNARRTIQGAMGVCAELVLDPRARLMEMAAVYYEARALHIAAEARVADVLDSGDHEKGMSADDLGRRIGIKEHKIARVLRTLCSAHVFQEVSYNHFANNVVSQVLVANDPLRAGILVMGWANYTASTKLPETLLDPVKTQSESALQTAFQAAHGTQVGYFEWMEEPIKRNDGSTQPKRELATFGLAMWGSGRAMGWPLYYDYPWQNLGSATVVDVGGGVGGFSLELSKIHSNLKFVIEDRPAVLKQAETVWNQQAPAALQIGRTKLLPHDFFTDQPVKNAEVYHMRYIMHDWPDEDCVKILQAIRPAMGPNSRILISDAVMIPTCRSSTETVTPAPYPLPANYGFAHRFQNMRDLNMLTLFNGRERGPDEWKELARKAGLRVEKIWECRGYVWITEMRKGD
ncbi:hypothetical protein EIP91_005869 [Steccherinum ochraceum]|uniref:Uncharacterized protein n=1 Tax=Steccherinum ochraceum TaxID=92696 RepID=A0A4R0R6U8_9APHY|nr:hypothetical protein EIP91_005869 [Steccherinum ochraceum]